MTLGYSVFWRHHSERLSKEFDNPQQQYILLNTPCIGPRRRQCHRRTATQTPKSALGKQIYCTSLFADVDMYSAQLCVHRLKRERRKHWLWIRLRKNFLSHLLFFVHNFLYPSQEDGVGRNTGIIVCRLLLEYGYEANERSGSWMVNPLSKNI